MFGIPLGFAVPALLAALIVLPVLYYLLRLTPPPPERVPLPTLPLVRDLVPDMQKPYRTPWWLLVLRLLIATLIILAMAEPIWNSRHTRTSILNAPLILMIDTGWAAASDWKTRVEFAIREIDAAKERPILVRGTAEIATEIIPVSSSAALEKLRSLAPQGFTPDRRSHFLSLENFIAKNNTADILWIADGIASSTDRDDFKNINQLLSSRLTIVSPQNPQAVALSNPSNAADALSVRVLRAVNLKDKGLVRALDAKGRVIGDAAYAFATGATETSARFDLPLEVRNDVSKLEISGENSAGAVALLDENNSRRRVGILTGESSDIAQPFVSASFFLRRALEPFADIREAPKGAPNPVERLINDNCNLIILADYGALSGINLEQLTAYVDKGGMLVRFAGPKLSANMDRLLPVKLRRGGRVLGGALSWDKPRKLGKFPDISPFATLSVQDDVTVQRQVLAEPDADLPSRSWAQLEDGTPLVTGARQGVGTLVLFHVTADTTWSNLPLSGQFVEILRKLVSISTIDQHRNDVELQSKNFAAPNRILDGFGVFQTPSVTARPVERGRNLTATPQSPAGFYGVVDASQAVNTLANDVKLEPMTYGQIPTTALELVAPLNLRAVLLVLALVLFLADAIIVIVLGGGLSKFSGLLAYPSPLVGEGVSKRQVRG